MARAIGWLLTLAGLVMMGLGGVLVAKQVQLRDQTVPARGTILAWSELGTKVRAQFMPEEGPFVAFSTEAGGPEYHARLDRGFVFDKEAPPPTGVADSRFRPDDLSVAYLDDPVAMWGEAGILGVVGIVGLLMGAAFFGATRRRVQDRPLAIANRAAPGPARQVRAVPGVAASTHTARVVHPVAERRVLAARGQGRPTISRGGVRKGGGSGAAFLMLLVIAAAAAAAYLTIRTGTFAP